MFTQVCTGRGLWKMFQPIEIPEYIRDLNLKDANAYIEEARIWNESGGIKGSRPDPQHLIRLGFSLAYTLKNLMA
jgi:hypothetical protein